MAAPDLQTGSKVSSAEHEALGSSTKRVLVTQCVGNVSQRFIRLMSILKILRCSEKTDQL